MISKVLAQPFALIVYLWKTNVKPVVDHQRRLTHAMRDVVKKEVIKLLNAGSSTRFRIASG
jgi:hypothetical protein